jgi:excinuclease ABC subunit B
LRKRIADITDMLAREDADTEELMGSGRSRSRGKAPVPGRLASARSMPDVAGLPSADLLDLVTQLTDQMHSAAAELQFEVAARLRDEINELKKELRQMMAAGAR